MPPIKAQLETLSNERADLLDKAKKLIESAETAELTDELSAEIDDLTQQAEVADQAIAALVERDNKIKAKLEAIGGFADRSSDIAAARGVHVAAPGSDEPTAAKLPATVRRYGRLENFTGDVNGVRAEERAYRFGQYALAKLSRDLPGKYGGHFRQACAFAADQFGMGQIYAAHYEGAGDTSGSHIFVPDEFENDLIRLRESRGVARQALRVRPMASDIKKVPRRTSGLTHYYVGEAAQITESTAGYDQVTLTAKKVGAIAVMSTELDEDSVIDFGDELAGEIGYAFANAEDEALFNGDGTSTYGGVQGLRNRLDTLTAGTAPGLVLGAGNAYSELTIGNFESLVGALPQYADVPGQVAWYCHKVFAWSVFKRLALVAGGNTKDDIEGNQGMFFLGYPVRVSQVMPSTEANDQIPCIFGNLNLGAKMGSRRGETIEFSTEATVGSANLFEDDLMAVKGTERFALTVHDFGTDTVAGPICGLQMAGS